MSATINIQLTPGAQAVAAKLAAMPGKLPLAVANGMKLQDQLTVSLIQAAHLTGRGPFPPEQHRLGVRTGRLRGSARASSPVVAGNTVTSAIGSNVIYAAIHEFGGVIHKPARQGKVRLKLDARGNLVRQLVNSNLAVFAKASHKRAREVNVQIGAHDINLPERAPFRTGIQESLPGYQRNISAAIIAEWNKGGAA